MPIEAGPQLLHYRLASVYAGLRDTDQAFEMLEIAVGKRGPWTSRGGSAPDSTRSGTIRGLPTWSGVSASSRRWSSLFHSTQILRNPMESLDTGGNAGQKKRRHLNKTLKRRPDDMPF